MPSFAPSPISVHARLSCRTRHPIAAALLVASTAALAAEPVPTARRLADPVTAADHLRFHVDWDDQLGGFDEGERQTLTARAHASFELSGGGRLVWRSGLPLVRQEGLALPGRDDPDVGGIGDIDTALLYVPAGVDDQALQWGIGLAARLPTASEDGLGHESGALGPAFAIGWTGARWSAGALLLHHQALGGDGDPDHLTRFQPFVARDFGPRWSVGVDVESEYDWDRGTLKGPLTLYTRHARSHWAWEGGLRYWVDGPTSEPEWGVRVGLAWIPD